MEQVNLTSLSLGPLDADDDENLHEYFVTYDAFEKVKRKESFLIIGGKGTGKSAIKKYLYNKRELRKELTISLDDTYSISLSDLKASSLSEIKNKLKGYLVGIVLKCILDSPNIPDKSKKKLEEFENEVPLIQKLLAGIRVRIPFVEIAIKDLFKPQKKGNLLRVIGKEIIEAIKTVLDDRDIWIVIDDIDSIFTSDDEKRSLKFIEGLIYASSDLTIKIFKKSVFICLLLKSEIYEELCPFGKLA
jgi:hypothetical protein